MPKIPTYQAEVAYRPAQGDVQAAGAPGMALARGAGQVFDVAAHYVEAQKKAQEVAELSKLNIQAAEQMGNLELEFERDTDFATVPQRFKQKTAEMREQLLQSATSSNVKTLFQRDFDKLAISKGISVNRDAFKRQTDAGVADLDANLDTYAGLAAKAKNDVELADIVGMARLEINGKANAGFITREAAGKRERAFFSKVDEQQVLARMNGGEAQVNGVLADLRDPEKYPNLDEVARERMIRSGQSRSDALARERVASVERNERMVERELKRQGEELAKDGWDRHANGMLTVDWLRENKRTFSEPDYRALLHAATSDTGKTDDKETLIDLRSRLDTDDLSADAARALRENKITTNTYNSIIERNRSVLKDDQPQSPYKAGRDLVRSTLDPTNLLTGPAAQIGKVGMANALAEFDDWAVANPRATRQEYQDEARATIQRYQVITYEEMALSLGLPRFYKGTRTELNAEALDQSEKEIIQRLDSKALTESQATQELQKIENWRAILRAKPTGKK